VLRNSPTRKGWCEFAVRWRACGPNAKSPSTNRVPVTVRSRDPQPLEENLDGPGRESRWWCKAFRSLGLPGSVAATNVAVKEREAGLRRSHVAVESFVILKRGREESA